MIDVRAPAEADRRIASILFADLSGFTTLSEQLDPEDVRALQSDLITEVSAAILQQDGFIEKYVGDAVLAVFGAPVAHEDDPERALRSALEMCKRVAGMSQRWEQRLGRRLEIHVGVNTGPVVAGHVGTGASSAYAVTGDTVNTAARLQGHAGPSEILVSEPTWRLTRHAFSFEPLGAVPLKGKAEPVAVYRLLDVLERPGMRRGLGLHGLTAPLVGRDEQLDTLLATYDRMLAGYTQVVSITGEPGAGKSRLLQELMTRLEADGRLDQTAVRQTACSVEGEQTYGVIAALMRDAFQVAPDDSLDVAREKLAAGLHSPGADAAETLHLASVLGHVLGLAIDHETIRHLEPDQVKRQLYQAARAAMQRKLAEAPMLLIVEDAHWADAASVELLEFLLDRQNGRLMLLTTGREVPGFRGISASHAAHTAFRLEPLSAQDGEQLLQAYFGESTALPERMRALLIERAGGNPLHLEELLRDLIERGVLEQSDGQWTRTTDVETSDVPATLHGLLLSRIDRLEPSLRQVLQEAAVIGHRFDDELLRSVTAETANLDPTLDRLIELQLLVLIEPELDSAHARRSYTFRHALLQETVYQNLLVRRRADLHTRVGTILEQRVGAHPQRLEEVEALGHHWSLGNDKARGARYLLAAGDWARDRYANEDALRHYRRALDTLGRCEAPSEMLPAVNERLGDLLGLAGDRAAATLHYQNALTCHQRAGDLPAQARQLRRLADLLWSAGDRAGARQLLQQGLDLLQNSTDAIECAHQYQAMGRLSFRNGDHAAAADWARRAIAHAERAIAQPATGTASRGQAASALSLAHNTLGVAMARMDEMAMAKQHLETSVDIAEANDLLQTACRGLANLSVLYSTLNPRHAIETCSRGLQMAKRIGDFALQSRLYANLAVAYCALTNRCDEHGLGAAQAAIDLDRRMGQLDHLTVPLIVLAQIHQCHGEPNTALRYYREALAIAEDTGEPQLLFPCYDGLASLYLDAGDEATAEAYMLKAQAICEERGVDPQTLVVLPFLD